MGLGESLIRVLEEFPAAREQELTAHPLAAVLRGDLAEEIAEIAGPTYKVTGSPGLGNWAETPWVSIFEPSITTTAQRGFYVCYLFRRDGDAVFLSLNQGTTEVHERVGGRRYLRVLADQAAIDVQLLAPQDVGDFLTGELDLPGERRLTRGYRAGNIAAKAYERGGAPDESVLRSDLSRFLDLYGVLIEAREGVNESTGEELPDGVDPGEEAKRFRWHRRAERNPQLAKRAKAYHGLTCRVCGFNFEEKYGPHGAGYIEAHHLLPFATLVARPDKAILDPKTDFTVVCANCHRMLHRVRPPLTPHELRRHIPS